MRAWCIAAELLQTDDYSFEPTSRDLLMLSVDQSICSTSSPNHIASMEPGLVALLFIVAIIVIIIPLSSSFNWLQLCERLSPPHENILNEHWAVQLEQLESQRRPSTNHHDNTITRPRAIRILIPPAPSRIHTQRKRIRTMPRHRRSVSPVVFYHSPKSSLESDNHGGIMQTEGNVITDVDGVAEETGGDIAADADVVTEFAGKASYPSNLSGPLQLATNFDWNADTGATSHMTPHRNFLRNYTIFRTTIRLADNTVVYSEGVGDMLFHPIVNGRPSRAIQFTRVLHVPTLGSSLLSCLYLTRNKGYEILITAKELQFRHDGILVMTAAINANNAAHLDGTTETTGENANITTCPLDLNLWHRRFAHHNYADVKKMVQRDMVTGLEIKSKEHPDPICEPCLAGKMHSKPFHLSSTRATHPLELVHSDLCGPLPQSHNGFKYWITFIDDCTGLRVAFTLKHKSESFEAFKTYKAWAENQLDAKIKALQDDKGGEYMSTAFIRFTDQCGIIRRHTTRNRPQQNGVAERANRTMADDITAMLNESGLPASFWNEALAAMIHVWNRLPTSFLPSSTPHEEWYKKKPDVSHLRVFGCTAYVFIQKDQQKKLSSHAQKCIFVGYPPGYFFFFFFFFLSTIYNAVLERSPRAHNTNSAYSKTTLRIARYYTTKCLGTSFWRANAGRSPRIFQCNGALSSGEKVETPQHGSAHTVASHQIALGRSPDRNPPQRAGQSPEGVEPP
jgi:transposase InsO family protein